MFLINSGWDQRDSTTSTKYFISCPCELIALHQNVANRQNTLTMLTLRWRIFPQDIYEWVKCV